LVINNLILEAKKIKSEAISDSSLAMQKRADHRKIVEKNSEVISIIQGENDRLVPMAKMKDMTRGFNNEIIIIPKAGHMGQHENTKAVSKAIEKILK
jgi:predicted alpha/beta hydrolase family esterase